VGIVEFQSVTKKYGGTAVLNELDLVIEKGDFMVVFGLPGCGKSVLVRLLMGLDKPDSGKILLRGDDVRNIRPGFRNIGYIPQSFALINHMDIYKNIAYPLKLQRISKDEIKKEVHRVAKMLDIDDLLEKKPAQTSGGQKQRIAIARGLIKRSDIYVFDDPLVGLDFKLREKIVDDLRNLRGLEDTTFIYTTSDSLETFQLAEKATLLDGGKVIESTDPFSLYMKPQREESMRILGFPTSNMLEASLESNRIHTNGFSFTIPEHKCKATEIIVGIRPEHISMQQKNSDDLKLDTTVALREDLGGEEIVYLDCADITLTMMAWHYEEKDALELGKPLTVYVARENIICFDADTKERLLEVM